MRAPVSARRSIHSLIRVEAAAGLAAEVPGGYHFLEQRSRSVLLIVEVAVVHLYYVQVDQNRFPRSVRGLAYE